MSDSQPSIDKQAMQAPIEVDYISRVEGETALRILLPDQAQPLVELRIFEPPRFFEGFLVGRRYDEVGDIVSRICGICPVSHMLTAIVAIERAMGVQVSPQTRRLRHIASMSQIMASHLVHLYALVLPDHVNHDGLAEMLLDYPQEAMRLMRMRKVVNDLTTLIGGGRALHPIGMVVGGFTKVPTAEEIAVMRQRLIELRDDAKETVKLAQAWVTPDLTYQAECVAIRSPQGYAFGDGAIISTAGMRCRQHEYPTCFEERQVLHGMAKHAAIQGRGAMRVGALSRVNLNYDRLHPRARQLAEDAGLTVPDFDPFHNNLAQSLEVAHCIEECADAMDGLTPLPEPPTVSPKPGEGMATTEAPRGLLHHHYALDRRGIVQYANILTPTVHNVAAMENDLRELTNRLLDQPRQTIRHYCQMLVRAYDPCFSCSVH